MRSEWLSNYQKEIKNKLHINDDHVDKLITDLTDKSHYILHYKNLQLYIQLGMKLNKIRKCLSYKSEAWLKDYITSNSVLRQKAKADGDAFKTNIYKIKNNSVFGKQMENVRNRVDIKLMKDNKLTDDKNSEYLKLISQPRFKKRTILNKNLVAVHRHKKMITLDKPILNGMIILDLSKYLMYDFYYNVLQKRYGDKIKLLMTDTDSLCVEIETDDVYEDMGDMKEYYDFSEYPKNHKLYNTENQAVVGKFKDEFAKKDKTKGNIITEFVGLRSKLYSITSVDDEGNIKEKRIAKGVKKCVIDKGLHNSDYNETLENKTQLRKDMNFIKSKLHNVNTVKVNKICLSAYDNKRFILDDGISTLSYGNYRI